MNRRNRRITLAVTVPLIFIAVVVWTALSQSTIPHFQGRTTTQGMAGVTEQLVNFWIDPAAVGENELTAQVASIIGTPTEVGGVVFRLTPPESSEEIEIPAAFAGDDAEHELSYVATANLDRPGTWQITVWFQMGGGSNTVDFDVEVAE